MTGGAHEPTWIINHDIGDGACGFRAIARNILGDPDLFALADSPPSCAVHLYLWRSWQQRPTTHIRRHRDIERLSTPVQCRSSAFHILWSTTLTTTALLKYPCPTHTYIHGSTRNHGCHRPPRITHQHFVQPNRLTSATNRKQTQTKYIWFSHLSPSTIWHHRPHAPTFPHCLPQSPQNRRHHDHVSTSRTSSLNIDCPTSAITLHPSIENCSSTVATSYKYLLPRNKPVIQSLHQ